MNTGLMLIFLLMFYLTADGQNEPPELKASKDVPPLKDRLFYGGSFGLQFGTFTDIEVSPIIAIWVLPRIGVAVETNSITTRIPLTAPLFMGAEHISSISSCKNITIFSRWVSMPAYSLW